MTDVEKSETEMMEESGGQDHVKLTKDVLHIDEAVRLVTSPSAGAVATFMGTTRDNFEGKTVVRLEYEAYEPMAEQEMKKICQLIRQRWDVLHIAVFHRLGLVPTTEASVIIAVSSAHRREGLEAVQYGIDTLKASVPIWKKEVYADGGTMWKENKECCWKS